MAVPQLVEILKRPRFREINPTKVQDVCWSLRSLLFSSLTQNRWSDLHIAEFKWSSGRSRLLQTVGSCICKTLMIDDHYHLHHYLSSLSLSQTDCYKLLAPAKDFHHHHMIIVIVIGIISSSSLSSSSSSGFKWFSSQVKLELIIIIVIKVTMMTSQYFNTEQKSHHQRSKDICHLPSSRILVILYFDLLGRRFNVKAALIALKHRMAALAPKM